jgi:hypothetical protein
MEPTDLLTLPFDQYQRYTAVVQVADRLRAHLQRVELSVLDVGGFFRTLAGEAILPLTHFLPQDQIVVVDRVAERLPNYLLADGRCLPFRSQAFDLAVSCDTLEHIPAAGRPAFLDELLRVTRHCLVLVAPFDSETNRRAEKVLQQYITSQGLRNQPLEEHIALGLPALDAVRAHFSERGLATVDLADGYVHRWLLMMLVKHTAGRSLHFHLELDRCYNQSLSPSDRREPAYRRVFVVTQPGDERFLEGIAGQVHEPADPAADPEFDLFPSLVPVLELCQNAAVAEALRADTDQPTELQAALAALNAENRSLRQLVASYEQGRFIRLMRRLHGWRSKLGL